MSDMVVILKAHPFVVLTTVLQVRANVEVLGHILAHV